jgi:hypothetical protein
MIFDRRSLIFSHAQIITMNPSQNLILPRRTRSDEPSDRMGILNQKIMKWCYFDISRLFSSAVLRLKRNAGVCPQPFGFRISCFGFLKLRLSDLELRIMDLEFENHDFAFRTPAFALRISSISLFFSKTPFGISLMNRLLCFSQSLRNACAVLLPVWRW